MKKTISFSALCGLATSAFAADEVFWNMQYRFGFEEGEDLSAWNFKVADLYADSEFSFGDYFFVGSLEKYEGSRSLFFGSGENSLEFSCEDSRCSFSSEAHLEVNLPAGKYKVEGMVKKGTTSDFSLLFCDKEFLEKPGEYGFEEGQKSFLADESISLTGKETDWTQWQPFSIEVELAEQAGALCIGMNASVRKNYTFTGFAIDNLTISKEVKVEDFLKENEKTELFRYGFEEGEDLSDWNLDMKTLFGDDTNYFHIGTGAGSCDETGKRSLFFGTSDDNNNISGNISAEANLNKKFPAGNYWVECMAKNVGRSARGLNFDFYTNDYLTSTENAVKSLFDKTVINKGTDDKWESVGFLVTLENDADILVITSGTQGNDEIKGLAIDNLVISKMSNKPIGDTTPIIEVSADAETQEMTVTPNPTNDEAKISFPAENVEMSLYSLSGARLATWTHNNESVVSLKQYADGMYIVSAKHNGRQYSGKILLKK